MKKILLILAILTVCSVAFGLTKPDWLQIVNTPLLDVKSFGATGNGTTNDIAAVNAALASGSIVFPAGTFYCEGVINVPSNRRIVGLPGSKVMLASGTGFRNVIDQQVGGASPTLTGSNAAGAGVITTAGAAAVAGNWYRIRSSAAIASAEADFVSCHSESGGNITIDQRLSVPFVAASGGNITNLAHSRNISFESLNVECTGTVSGSEGFAFYLTDALFCEIKDCTINGASKQGAIYLLGCAHIQVTSNFIYNNTQIAVFLPQACSKVVITGNNIVGQKTSDGGIHLNGFTNDCVVSNNVISGTPLNAEILGIELQYGCSRNVISGNVIDSMGIGVGVYESFGFGATKNIISNNVIKNCFQFGVFFNTEAAGNSDNVVTGNVLTNCGNANTLVVAGLAAAITLNANTNRTIVSNNSIFNSNTGVYAYAASNNNIDNNRFYSVPYPINLTSTTHNKVRYNECYDCNSNFPMLATGTCKFNEFRGNFIEVKPTSSYGAIWDTGEGYANKFIDNVSSGPAYCLFLITATETSMIREIRGNSNHPRYTVSGSQAVLASGTFANTPADVPAGFRVYSIPFNPLNGQVSDFDYVENIGFGKQWLQRNIATETVVTF